MLVPCVALLTFITACMIHYLPSDFAVIAASWAMLSLSAGISFGHCVLNEP